MIPLDRRQFIKALGGIAGASLLAGSGCASPSLQTVLAPLARPSGKSPDPNRKVDGLGTGAYQKHKYTMVIDVGACIGCRTCQAACKKENNIPDTISPPWIEVFQLKNEVEVTGFTSIEDLNKGSTTSYTKSPLPGMWYMPVACNHCSNPACVKVCPVGATYQDKDGLVLMDYDRCIGCRFCVVACPYSARRFNWFKPEVAPQDVNPELPVRPVGVAEKCTWCVHRIRRGKLPRCVEACPVGARHFGDLKDPDSDAFMILESERGYRLLEDMNTHPNIVYITRGKKYTR